MDYQTLSIIGYILAAFAGLSLIASIAMFFGFQIPALYKDLNGTLQQKQIAEIRRSSRQLGRVNVFEQLEKKAGARRSSTGSLNMLNTGELNAAQSGSLSQPAAGSAADPGTMVLQNAAKNINPGFIIEKNIMFVSTSEVL